MRVRARLITLLTAVALIAAPLPAHAAAPIPARGPDTQAARSVTERNLERKYNVVIRHVKKTGCGHAVKRGRVAGCYWNVPGKRAVIQIAAPASTYKTRAGRFVIHNVMRHEVAHARIMATCGTISPKAAKGRPEHVTDAYAVRYLRGDKKVLRKYGSTPYTAADWRAAGRIHSGRCS